MKMYHLVWLSYTCQLGYDQCWQLDCITNGDKLWTMEISSPNALSINLLYDKFWLPEGTSLFLYSKDKKQYMGGFTSINNKGDSINLKGFATGIIQGSNVILEYYQPAHISQTAIISICNVVHGYKPIVAPAILTRSFRGSGNCQVNINCPEGEDWQKEKRAIALIVVKWIPICNRSTYLTQRLTISGQSF